MRYIKWLIINELRGHFHSFKFIVLIVIALIVTCTMMFIKTENFKEQMATYQTELLNAEYARETFRVYSEFYIPILIAPNPSSLFAEGFENKAGNKATISLHEAPELQTVAQTKNTFSKIFINMDVIDIVLIILGIMTIFMVSGTISSEKDNQILRLILSNNIGRSQYFSSKYIGNMITLTLALLLIFFIAILFIFFQSISITLSDLLKIAFIFLLCELFISVYVLLSLTISAYTKTASISIISGLSVWLLLAFIYPNLINFTVRHFSTSPSIEQLNMSIKDIEKRTNKSVWEQWNLIQGDKNWTFSMFTHGTFGVPDLVGLTQKYVFDEMESAVIQNIPLVLQSQQEICELKQAYKERLIHQRDISSLFLYIVPGYLLKELTSQIAGTDYYQRDVLLTERINSYRSRVMDYLKTKGAIGLKYFTQMQKEDMLDNFQEYSQDIHQKYKLNNFEILNTADSPVFQSQKKFHINSLEVILLVIYNLLLYILGQYLFNRCNIL